MIRRLLSRFGISIRRVPREEVLRAGDKMTINLDQVDKYFADPHSGNILVEVVRVTRNADDSKEIWVKHAVEPLTR